MSSEYIKQLEETIELLKKKFEDYSIENESFQNYFWNDLTCILPKQVGQIAYSLVYHHNGQSQIGLSMEKGDYTNSCNDIVTQTDVWDNIYGKTSSTSFSFLDKIKQCKDISVKSEIVRTLYTVILKESNRIAQNTRRNCGNVIVTSEEVATYFTLLDEFTGVKNNDRRDGFRIHKSGNIGRFTVFVDNKNTSNKSVVMYKGDKPQDGAGVILDNRGMYHWYRPIGYENYWNVIDIT
jgi:hypothetical protein